MGKIKVSNFIAKFLAENELVGDTVFMVSGGGNMHLIDALGRCKKLNYICNHHEQACTFAAEGYARVTNKIGVAYVTTGPGGTNAITGVYSAWVDSIPTLTVSGQVKFETTIASEPYLKLRQLGDQEINIVDIVKPITKYAVMVTDKKMIKYHLQKAIYEAKSGRAGPVWLDIPLDIQGAYIEEEELTEFTPLAEEKYDLKLDKVIEYLKNAKRPVIIGGNGIVLADAKNEFLKLIEKLKIPVIGTFARYDIVDVENPYFFGRYGTVGNRMANFTVQNADLILAIGARMNIRAVSYNWEYFAREAKIISIDIDKAELCKKTINVDLKIKTDAKIFINELLKKVKEENMPSYEDWIEKCNQYKRKYPMIEEKRKKIKDYVDSYNFFNVLSKVLKNNKNIYVLGNGTACVSAYQSLQIYTNDRVVVNSGCASMGYDLPAAIGACIGGKQEVVCVTGDGSLQMNIQELQTIIHNNLPIKLFVLNNEGYISIRNTQNNFFNGHKVGSDKESGISCPNIVKIANAYGFKTFRIENQQNLEYKLRNLLQENGSFVCEVVLSPNEKMEPKLSSKVKPDGRIVSKPLEDMYPFLDREEFKENMIIKIVDED
jgi:acetolactate synthase-1/2/3 large subunit